MSQVEAAVGDIPKLMEERRIDEDTQMWKAGMAEWLALGEAKTKVAGLLKVVLDGEERRENKEDGGLKDLFAEMDEDGSGALDEGEIGLLLGKLGYELGATHRVFITCVSSGFLLTPGLLQQTRRVMRKLNKLRSASSCRSITWLQR